VIKLMVNLLLSPEKDLRKSHVVKTIYDPACGTGGMLSVAEKYIRDLNREASPHLFGQDLNDEAWAVCKSDMLIKGEDADNIRLGDTFTQDGFDRDPDGRRITFDLPRPRRQPRARRRPARHRECPAQGGYRGVLPARGAAARTRGLD
jgi:type I restriction enzyme M protein